MKEPPTAEVVGYMWPALVQSSKMRFALEMTKCDLKKNMREMFTLFPRHPSTSYALVRKHTPTGELGTEVAFDAVAIKFSETVQQRTPGLVMRA